MISILQFNVKTQGNYITPTNSNITYTPSKNSEEPAEVNTEASVGISLGTDIFITPNIRFTIDDVKDFISKTPIKDIKNIKDYKKIFVSIELFKKFINYLKMTNAFQILTVKNSINYKMLDNNNNNNNNNKLLELKKKLNLSNKEIEKLYTIIKSIFTKFINESLKKIKLLQNNINNYNLTIKEIINKIQVTDNKDILTKYEEDLFKKSKDIVITQNNIIKTYYNIIKAVEFFNEERNKIIVEKKKFIEEKNEIIRDNQDTIKKMNVIRDKSIIDEIKKHITNTTNEVKRATNEIKSLISLIQKGLNSIKLYENNIKNEENLMNEEKKSLLMKTNKKLEKSQIALKEFNNKKQELTLKLRTSEIEKKKYDNEITILIQEQKNEQAINNTYITLIATLNEKFDKNSPLMFSDNKVKIIYDYNNNLIIKETLNKAQIQEKIDRLTVNIYNEIKKYILNNNIRVIKDVFFSYKKPFIINSKKYIIYKIRDISRGFIEDLSFKDEKNKIEGKYSFTIELTIARNDGKIINIDFMNLSCIDKAKNLQSETNKLFDMSSNYITGIMKPIILSESNKPTDAIPRTAISVGGQTKIQNHKLVKKINSRKTRKTRKTMKTMKKMKTRKN